MSDPVKDFVKNPSKKNLSGIFDKYPTAKSKKISSVLKGRIVHGKKASKIKIANSGT